MNKYIICKKTMVHDSGSVSWRVGRISRSCFQPCNPEKIERWRALGATLAYITKGRYGGEKTGGDQRADTGQGPKRNNTGLSSTTQEGNDFTFKKL